MSDRNENRSPEEEKKQFYSINLTPERVFMIFVGIIVILAIITVAVAFSLSSKPTTKDKNVASQDVIDEIINSEDFEYYDIMAEKDSGILDETEDLADAAILDTEKEKTENGIFTEEEEMKNRESETFPKGKKAEVTINDKVVYSSSYHTPKESSPTIKKSQPVTRTSQNKPKPISEAPKPKPAPKVSQPPAPKTKPSAPVSGKIQKWVIQVGSFSTKKPADEIASFYKNAGYPVYTKEFVKEGRIFYRLRIGPFDSESKAKETLSNIKSSKYGKDSFISVGYF